MNRKLIAILVAVAALLCTACAFFPEEEVLPKAPVILASQKENYILVEVTRGDLVQTVSLDCKYQAALEERLCFSVPNEPIGQIYVSKGDTVTAGTLLLEIDNTQLQSQITAQQKTLDLVNLQVAQTEEQLGLYYERCSALDDAVAADPSYESQSQAAERYCLRLYNELEFLKRQQTIEQTVMDGLLQKLSERQIFASMDGTVAYIVELSENEEDLSIANCVVCIISDVTTGRFTSSAFRTVLDKGNLKLNDEVTITTSIGQEYPARIVEMVTDESDEEVVNLSFQLIEPDTGLGNGTSGTIDVVTDRRDDVLYLPETAVELAKDGTVVYCLDENGIKIEKPVETGLVANGMVEIVSGLEEGELVIK